MVKTFLKKFGFALMTLMLVQVIAFAAETGSPSTTEPKDPAEASFKSRCASAKDMMFPDCADSPSECGSKPFSITSGGKQKSVFRTPFNCLFLQEPIGGKTGYDLYKAVPTLLGDQEALQYTLWYGEAIVGKESGPFQAILAYEAGKETQGPFGLLYNYLGLIYNFLSGVIVAFVVLVAIIGGIRMSISHGDETAYTAGKKMILKALVGMVLWFTASVILYTINPTFFAF